MLKLSSWMLLALALLSFQAWAEFPPDGFRGIKWGTDISELKDMKKDDESGVDELYIKEGDKYAVGEAELTAIFYSFFNGKFYGAYFFYAGITNRGKLEETLIAAYDDPTGVSETQHMWGSSVDTVLITHRYDKTDDTGMVAYIYHPINNLKLEADKLSDKEKGVDDL